MLTWNIWFDRNTMEQRLPLILDTIEAQKPDIIALQVCCSTLFSSLFFILFATRKSQIQP